MYVTTVYEGTSCRKTALKWKHEYPELEKKIDGSAVDVIADLMRLDMGVLYKKL